MSTDIEKTLEELFEPPVYLPDADDYDQNWTRRLNPTQQKGFDSVAKFVLFFGEKGSGKSWAGLDALVRHCYEEEDALALIIAPQIRTGKEGVMYDLQFILDQWRHGNKDKDGNRLDKGLGLDFTEPQLDPNTKDRCIYIGNRHGGWSKVILISIPYAQVVEKRMKALSPSFVYLDEITELDGIEYFTYVSAQLGRRRKIKGPQQYFASCNPAGPSHWVYKVFWIDCIDEATGQRDHDYEIYHVPIEENRHNLPDGYIEGLEKIFKDPIDRQRLLDGIWVDRPTGDAIFKNYFQKEIHVRPRIGSDDWKAGHRIVPIPGFPIIVGYDPGPANFSVHFLQMIPTKLMICWNVIDELNCVGQYKPFKVVVPAVLEKMDFWSDYLKFKPRFVHIADEAAFSHARQDGSYDSMTIQRLSENRIRLRACPKGKESVPQRTSMLVNMLLDDSLHVSATCTKTIQMFEMLASEKEKDGKYDASAGLRPRRSIYLHSFDSLTYPIFYFQLMPGMFTSNTQQTGTVYTAGRRSQ